MNETKSGISVTFTADIPAVIEEQIQRGKTFEALYLMREVEEKFTDYIRFLEDWKRRVQDYETSFRQELEYQETKKRMKENGYRQTNCCANCRHIDYLLNQHCPVIDLYVNKDHICYKYEVI